MTFEVNVKNNGNSSNNTHLLCRSNSFTNSFKVFSIYISITNKSFHAIVDENLRR